MLIQKAVLVPVFFGDVCTDRFLFLDDLLTDAQHFFDHRPLLHHDLFLDHGDQDLIVANLNLLGCLAFLNGDALHVRLFALLGNPNRLLVVLIGMVAPMGLTPSGVVASFL
jgi:hypothetical protein